MRLTVFFGVFLLYIFSSCSDSGEAKHTPATSNTIKGYNLSKPTRLIKLPSELDEISGIEYLGNNELACVQDEEATIYIFDLDKNIIKEKIKFGQAGDFEDLRKVDNGYYILRSDGAIFHYVNGNTTEYNLFASNCNTEGLCYIKEENCLLISCKDKSRKIWRFDLSNHTLRNKEDFIISDKHIHVTAMAFDPSNKDLFILSTKQLGIFSRDGKTKETIELDKTLFPQPEGIAFKENGDLLISNEAKGNEATILEFKHQNSEAK